MKTTKAGEKFVVRSVGNRDGYMVAVRFHKDDDTPWFSPYVEDAKKMTRATAEKSIHAITGSHPKMKLEVVPLAAI